MVNPQKNPTHPTNSNTSTDSTDSTDSTKSLKSNSHAFNADMGMILDFFRKISSVGESDEIIRKSLKFFQLLFSPKSITIYQFGSGDSDETPNVFKFQNYQFSTAHTIIPERFLVFDTKYRWENEGNALIVKIETDKTKYGVVEISQFAHPEYKDRYLSVILLYANYFALALQNLLHLKLIEEKEQLLRIVADYSLDWEFWHDKEGNFLYNSPSCKNLTGYSVAEISNFISFMEKIIFKDDLARWNQHRIQVNSSPLSNRIEYRIMDKQGQLRWHEHVCQKIFDRQGTLLGFRGSNRDITERKISEEHVKVLQGMLPICAACKKIRSDEGYWEQIEDYLCDHSEVDFTHSICPACAKKLYDIDV
ncbi:MAG: PAS domain-containing protein [Promethearchaeota archaeon]